MPARTIRSIGNRRLARIPLAFPTYVGVLSRAAYRAAGQIDPTVAPAHRVML